MKIFDAGRPKYGKMLEQLLDSMNVNNILYVAYTVGSSGSVRVDVETKHKGVFSFNYSYGNLEFSRDKWTGKSNQKIMDELLETSLHFISLREYYAWRAMELFDN